MGCSCKQTSDYMTANYNTGYQFTIYCVLATARSIRPKMVIERVPWHGIMPPPVDDDSYGF